MGNNTKTDVNDMQAAAGALMHLKETADALNKTFGEVKPRLLAGNSQGTDVGSFAGGRHGNQADLLSDSIGIPGRAMGNNIFNYPGQHAFNNYVRSSGLMPQSNANSSKSLSQDTEKFSRDFLKMLSDKNYVLAKGGAGKKQYDSIPGGNDTMPYDNLFSSYGKANKSNVPYHHAKSKLGEKGQDGDIHNNLISKQKPKPGNNAPKPSMPTFNGMKGGGMQNDSPGNNFFKEEQTSLKELISNVNDKILQKSNSATPAVSPPGGSVPFSSGFGGASASKNMQSPMASNLFTNPAAASKGNDNKKVEIKLTGDGAGTDKSGTKHSGKNGIKHNATPGAPQLSAKMPDDLFHNSMKASQHGEVSSPSLHAGTSAQGVGTFSPQGISHTHDGGSKKGGKSGGAVFHVQNMSSHRNTHKHAIKSANDIHSHIVSVLTSAVADSKIGTDVH